MAFSLRKAISRPAVQKITAGWQQTPPFADWRSRARAQQTIRARQEIRQEASAGEGESFELMDWALRHRSIDDQPFSLDRFKPLQAIYRDDHPSKVIIKPAQVGVSEFAITLTIWAMVVAFRLWSTVKKGLNVGYLFPTQSALRDFAKERFAGLKRENQYMSALFSDSEFDDVGFKQIGDSYLYLRGAWSVAGLKSFPCDLLILDEYDEMDPAAVELARKRYRQSEIKREVCISTPTLPEVGIHARYLASDQRVWEVQCILCSAFTELDYFRDVRANGKPYETWRKWNKEAVSLADWTVHCPACKESLDRFGPGRWTAKRPDVTTLRGYHVPALCFPAISLSELGQSAISKDPTVLTEFYRSDLGLPFTAAGSRLSEDMLLKLFVALPDGELPETKWLAVTMGVDVGSMFNIWIEGTSQEGLRCVLYAGMVESWDQVETLLRQYKVVSCVVDARPEEHAAKQFSDRFKGRVKRAFYPNGMGGDLFRIKDTSAVPKTALQKRAEKAVGKAREDDIPPDVVKINRTMAMDALYAKFAELEIAIPESLVRDEDVRKQLCAPVRVITKDDYGQAVASWQHTTPDDYFHAAVYCSIALAIMPRRTPGYLALGSVKGWQAK